MAQVSQLAHWPFDAPFEDGTIVPPRGATTIEEVHGDDRLLSAPGLPTISDGYWSLATERDGVNDELRTSPLLELPTQTGTISHWLWSDSESDTDLRIAFYTGDGPVSGQDYNGFGSAQRALEIHTGTRFGVSVLHDQDGIGGPTNEPAGDGDQISDGEGNALKRKRLLNAHS